MSCKELSTDPTLTETLRACKICMAEKPLIEFRKHPHARGGRTARCKACIKVVNDAWASRNTEAVKRKGKDYRDRHMQTWIRKYNLTPHKYWQMVSDQKGVCAICLHPETRVGRDGLPTKLAVDHDHVTGKVRGLLCFTCNVLIGLAKEQPITLRASADYLELHSE